MPHTHTGYKANTAYVHHGSRLVGHGTPVEGRTHALTGGPRRFTALCGEVVHLEDRDQFEFPRAPEKWNVRRVGDPTVFPVTCKRCLRAIKAEERRDAEREMTMTSSIQEWVGKLVRGSTQTLDIEPGRRVERVYYSAENQQWIAYTGEHIKAPTEEALGRRLESLAQPVRKTGRLSAGRYEVRG